MVINSLFNLVKQARFVKSVLKKYRRVLSPGAYYLFDNFRSVCVKKTAVQDKAQRYFKFEKPSRIRVRLAQILNRMGYFYVSSRRTTGDYEAIYLANNYDKHREIKLFSFSKNKVLTVCANHTQMQKQLCEYATLSHAYKMPAVVPNEQIENALDVDLIDCLDFPGDCQALTAIAKATMKYNQNPYELSNQLVKDLVTSSYDDEQINVLLQSLVARIDSQLLQCRLPMCLQHGDLSKTNLLYGRSLGCETFWFLDWEHKKERVFFYDYFFYVLASALFGEMGPINCYLSGQNDAVLGAFFAHFALQFSPDKRWDYLLIVAVCFLKERVCDLGHTNVLKNYCAAIDKLQQTAPESEGL